jgi:hypothetical protein
MSIPIRRENLRRILLARHFLGMSPTQLSPSASPLTVAQAVLHAHDAAELVTAAVASHIEAPLKQKMFLMEYIEAIEQKTRQAFPGRSFFSDLNEARRVAKHHGLLPAVADFHDAPEKTKMQLDSACRVHLGSGLEEIGLEVLIELDSTLDLYKQARNAKDNQDYKLALELLGRALRDLLDASPFVIEVGAADPKAALELIGLGVDPFTFLSMQEFLPTVHFNGSVEWKTRETGHQGNWTCINVDFCLEAFLDIAVKVQNAPSRPVAVSFDYIFDDVLTAKTNEVVVHALDYFPIATDPKLRRMFGVLSKGQTIRGHVIPALEHDPPSSWVPTDLASANLLVIQRPKADIPGPIDFQTVLLVRADLVELSYVPRDIKRVRERFPHLFRDIQADEG